MDNIYDMIIIGGGPAGYTAALYASRAGLDTLVVEKMSIGGQMALTAEVDNYPGFDEGIDGFTLGMKMQSGAERFGAKTQYSTVGSVDLSGQIKELDTDSGVLLARTVVIATGAEPRKLGIDGEREMTGRGIHYCAHCDGRFYKGKTVAVIGGGNSAVAEALYLSALASKVYLIHRRDSLRADKVYHKPLSESGNIEILFNSRVEAINGDGRLSGIIIEDTENGKKSELAVDGVFVAIGRNPATGLFADQLSLDEQGYIIADETTRTSIDGVYAVGDVRTKPLRQIVTAVADGATSAHLANEYLSRV